MYNYMLQAISANCPLKEDHVVEECQDFSSTKTLPSVTNSPMVAALATKTTLNRRKLVCRSAAVSSPTTLFSCG